MFLKRMFLLNSDSMIDACIADGDRNGIKDSYSLRNGTIVGTCSVYTTQNILKGEKYFRGS